jgi:chromosome partitioning protein
MKTIAFFNNKGGVGKTSLIYHLSFMYAERGIKVLAVDLDPQANLTSMFLNDELLEDLWADGEHENTVFGAINPVLRGISDIAVPVPQKINPQLSLLPGDLALSKFEDKLSDAWPRCHNRDEAAFRSMTAFHRMIEKASEEDTELVLIDVGPNLGSINRSALITADFICVPLAPDLFSLQGLKNLGPSLKEWRKVWVDLLSKAPEGLSMPKGLMKPIGYIVMQHGMIGNTILKSYGKWANRIPKVFEESVLENSVYSNDHLHNTNMLAQLKHYRSLMPMAMEARRPIFKLRSSDGAIGTHAEAVQKCYKDFEQLSILIQTKLIY